MSSQQHCGCRPDWINESRLWIVLDRKASLPISLPQVTAQAIAGGVDVVLCRIKDAPLNEMRVAAMDIRRICSQAGVPFVMSHFPELAAELGADAVQLGVGDPALEDVRKIVGRKMPVGYSTHSIPEAELRFSQGAAYVFLGPIFPTPEKLKLGKPLGSQIVSDAAALPGPVVYIGGINHANLQELVRKGARHIAAISALQRSQDIAASVSVMQEQLKAIR